jgi:hypothetical protein
MLLALTLCLSLLQDDPPVIVPNIDSSVRNISGYQQPKEQKVVGDDVFLRRIMKDLIDAVPADDEVQVFVNDRDPRKRSKKINGLLADDRFAAVWAKRFEGVFFVDVLKNPWTGLPDLTTEQRGKIVEAFTAWLASRLKADKPWTEIVTQMLDTRGTPEVSPEMGWMLSLRRGKGFEREFAENLPRTLLGVRIACARCHDHPYAVWNIENYYGMAAFVVRQRARGGRLGLELKYMDDGEMKGDSGNEFPPKFLYGGTAEKHDDRMKVLARLMTAKTNPQLPRMLVNRVWGWLFGSGIVDPVDDFNDRQTLSKPLLDAMTKSTVENNYSIKHLVRVLCNTQAYQMPTPAESPDAESFRHVAARKPAVRVYKPLGSPPPALPLTFEMPAAWARVKETSAAKGLFLIPHKEDPTRTAELWLFERLLPRDNWTVGIGKLDPVTSTVTALDGKGKLKITFTELAGPTWCRRESEGQPVDYRFWMAAVEGGKPMHFRVGGPADLLDPWKADFEAFLKTLAQK